jgi:hypothetical protein
MRLAFGKMPLRSSSERTFGSGEVGTGEWVQMAQKEGLIWE